MTFGNAVVGGAGKLIRKFIQSPDYVAGKTGWTVNADGTAEFNNATIRGTLRVRAATLGSQIRSIVFDDGYDTNGSVSESVNPAEGTASIAIRPGKPNNVPFVSTVAVTTDIVSMVVNDGTSRRPSIQLQRGLGYRFGSSMPFGLPYAETVTLDSTSLPNATVTSLKGFSPTFQKTSDYEQSCWDLPNGTFTAPDDGWYDVYLGVIVGSWVANSSLYVQVSQNGSPILGDEAQSAIGYKSAYGVIWLSKTDILTFQARQATGAAKAVSIQQRSRVTIARRIG